MPALVGANEEAEFCMIYYMNLPKNVTLSIVRFLSKRCSIVKNTGLNINVRIREYERKNL